MKLLVKRGLSKFQQQQQARYFLPILLFYWSEDCLYNVEWTLYKYVYIVPYLEHFKT
jgi:hypothetical protein